MTEHAAPAELEQERPEDAPEPGTNLAAPADGAATLARRPAIDQIPPRMLKLLEAKSPGLSHAERGQALELAVAYGLDPFANEIWFAKGRGRNGSEGKLLIMVGRDGLRKVAQRNGLEVDCDVVREKDTFAVTRGPDRTRSIHHDYEGTAEARGAVVGAWAECYERKSGRQRGFFFAPVTEYKPSGDSAFSPWSKQLSVMILAAAERQAVRQATPLGGLLVEGEDVLVNEGGEPAPAEDPLGGLPEPVRAVIERARRVGHVGYSDAATAQMATAGQPPERVDEWVARADAELDRMDGPEPAAEPEPEVVDAEAVADEDEPAPEVAPSEDDAPARAERLRERARELRLDAEALREMDDGVEATERDAEADALEAEADAVGDADQPELGL